MICQASRRWSTATTRRLYSSASSRASVGDVLVDRLDLDPEGSAGAGHPAADPAAPLGLEHRGGTAAAEAADPLDGRDHAVRRVAVLEPGATRSRPSLLARAASMAACAASSSSIGTTMPGSTDTMPSLSNRSDTGLNSREAWSCSVEDPLFVHGEHN